MVRVLLCLLLIFSFGCAPVEKKSSSVFFAGEIVNPTSSSVVLLKGDKVIDSVRLDQDNRFAFELDSINEGLYHFYHDPELQYVYLQNEDSILIRLNTMDFDESMVFEGIGADVNNFLLELFLASEEEQPDVISWYELEADEFMDKIHGLQEKKFALLKELITDGNLSENQRKLAKASVLYHYNTYKEQYPFRHRKSSKHQIREKLPKDFYAYRKTIDYGNENLTYLRPYYRFMVNHIQNLSFMGCKEECQNKNGENQKQLHFNEHKLHLIDSLVDEKELKDNLFRYVAFDYLLKVHDYSENNKRFISKFHELSKNNRHLSEIDELYQGIESLQPLQKVPEIYVNNVDGDTISLQEISKAGRTVFYFWSGVDKRHFDNIRGRVAMLTKEKPEYKFVGINMKTGETAWKSMLENSGLDMSLQFRSNNFDELTKSLIIYPENKCVIVEDGHIVDAFSNIYASL